MGKKKLSLKGLKAHIEKAVENSLQYFLKPA